jgi:hypothetical protein
MGEKFGTASQNISVGGEGVGILGLVLGVDPSGSLMKLAQILSLLNRVKYLNINFGIMLDSFLAGLNPGLEFTSELKDTS